MSKTMLRVFPLIAKVSAGKAALSLSQVEAPLGAGKPEGLLARGFATYPPMP